MTGSLTPDSFNEGHRHRRMKGGTEVVSDVCESGYENAFNGG